jgi:hypothetical protein
MEKFGSGIWDKHPGSATLPLPGLWQKSYERAQALSWLN